MAIRCLIVDDSQSFIEAARAFLEQEGLTVAGVASSGAEAVRQVETLEPDVVLVDIGLGDESGFDLTHRLAEERETPIVLISTRAEEDVAELVAASPAVGFLPKSELSASALCRLVDRRLR